MARFNIWRDYWLPMRQKSEKKFQEKRAMAQFKAKVTKQNKRVEHMQDTRDFRVIQENIDRIRGNQWNRHNAITRSISDLTIEDINKMNRMELTAKIDEANWAINTREADFLLHYRWATGNLEATFDFNRDNYAINDDMRVSELRHILRLQQLYLNRQNTWELFNKGLDDFMDRAFKREDVTMSLEEKRRYKRNFFDIYKRALEYSHLPKDSRGSPVYALVAEEMSKNPDVTIDEIMFRLDNGYEEEQEEEQQREREAGIVSTGFRHLPDKDIAP